MISDNSAKRIHRRLTRKRRLGRLQARIAPPVRAIDRATAEILAQISGRTANSAGFFKRYLSVCLEDAQVAAVVHGYSLNERSLHKIYVRLLEVGLDQWIRGQHVGLASISSPETLLYIARSRQRKRTWQSIANGLRRYFRKEIPSKELLASA